MNQSNQKAKKTYTTPEITLRGILLFPEDDFTKLDLKGTTAQSSTTQSKI